jgi:hypothetical protein
MIEESSFRLIQVRLGQVRSGQVRSGQVRSGQVRSGQVFLFHRLWLYMNLLEESFL